VSDVPPTTSLEDPGYRAAVVDLCGVLGYAELAAFTHMAADSRMAPTAELTARLARCAVLEYAHYEAVRGRLEAVGASPEEAMAPFRTAVDAFHARTRPSTWLEALVKAYVGNGIASDFYTEIGRFVDSDTASVIADARADAATADFVVEEVRRALHADRRAAGRLALFGRRIAGEAISQGQQVAADRDALAALVVGEVGVGGADLTEIGEMSKRLTDRHSDRMARLGLEP
jgi:hypothetical protein